MSFEKIFDLTAGVYFNFYNISAVTAMQQPSTSRRIFCVFDICASFWSRHLAYRAEVANMGLRSPLPGIRFEAPQPSRGTLWYGHSAV